jgi:hypothetical protein
VSGWCAGLACYTPRRHAPFPRRPVTFPTGSRGDLYHESTALMSDPGLTNRLQQHSRRAGLNVAITMALAIAICVLGFAAIYARLSPMMSDFVGQGNEVVEPPRAAADVPAARTTETPDQQPVKPPTPTPVAARPTATSAAFDPDYQITSTQTIRFRSEPSTARGDATILKALTPATALQYLDEDAPTADPATDGTRWMKFRIEEGTEGWVREIDVERYQA